MKSRKPLQLCLLLSAGLFVAVSAAGQVSGKLLLGAYKPEAPAPTRPTYNWELENGFKEVRPDRVDAVRELAVVLLGEGPAPSLERIEVTFSGGSLLPSTIAARSGATMLIRNDDEFAHEVSAQGLDSFPAEATSPRGRRSVQLSQPGDWPLIDNLVPHAKGHLHVFPNLVARAKVAANGDFAFTDLKPGKYQLAVFHGKDRLASQSIEVTEKALTLDPLTLSPKGSESN